MSTPEPLDRLFRGVFEAHADGYDAWLQAGHETGARASRLTIGTAHAFTIAPDGCSGLPPTRNRYVCVKGRA